MVLLATGGRGASSPSGFAGEHRLGQRVGLRARHAAYRRRGPPVRRAPAARGPARGRAAGAPHPPPGFHSAAGVRAHLAHLPRPPQRLGPAAWRARRGRQGALGTPSTKAVGGQPRPRPTLPDEARLALGRAACRPRGAALSRALAPPASRRGRAAPAGLTDPLPPPLEGDSGRRPARGVSRPVGLPAQRGARARRPPAPQPGPQDARPAGRVAAAGPGPGPPGAARSLGPGTG